MPVDGVGVELAETSLLLMLKVVIPKVLVSPATVYSKLEVTPKLVKLTVTPPAAVPVTDASTCP